MNPSASFEDEILSINPEYDLVFNKYDEKRLNLSPPPFYERKKISSNKMKIISTMNKMIGLKPVGELATNSDWEHTDSVEAETIAMMRILGLEQSVDQAPDAERTISTFPTNDDVIFMRNGHKKMSIFMADSYFAMKPLSQPSFDTEEVNTSANSSKSADLSVDVNTYEPLGSESSKDPCSSSEDYSFEKHNQSTGSLGRRSVEDNSTLTWRHRSPQPETSREPRKPKAKLYPNFSDTRTASTSNSNWRQSNKSSSDTRDESNWRVKAKTNEMEKPKEDTVVPQPNADSQQQKISQYGRPLFTPKELFMKKKAMMITQVLAENQRLK